MTPDHQKAGHAEKSAPRLDVTHEMVAALKVDRAVVDAISDLLAEMEVEGAFFVAERICEFLGRSVVLHRGPGAGSPPLEILQGHISLLRAI